VAEPVRARRLSDAEGQRLTQIVRRGKGGSIRVRRATMIMASASGAPVPAIARLVAADEDTVRDVIHDFNARGLDALDPQWAGGRPRLNSDAELEFVVATAKTRPAVHGLPFAQWSVRKLAAHLARCDHRCPHPGRTRPIRIGRERLRRLLRERGLSFQRTRTWKESTDPDKEAKLDRIEHVTSHYLTRCFAFDQFGSRSIRPCHGSACARETHPVRLPATYHRTHSHPVLPRLLQPRRRPALGDHPPPQRRHQHPRRSPIDPGRPTRRGPDLRDHGHLSANKTPAIRTWAARNKVELCLTPTYASWANPIEAQFGPLRTFTMGATNHPNHPALARRLQAYLRWRNQNARHPDVLAAQRRERARIRSERHQRWGRPRQAA